MLRMTTYRGEEDLPALVKRLYKIEGPESEHKIKEVEKKLLEVNSHLRQFKQLHPDAKIVVPEIPGVETIEEDHPAAMTASDLLGSFSAAIENIEPVMEAHASEKELAAKNLLAMTRGKGLREAVRDLPKAMEGIQELERYAEGNVEGAKNFSVMYQNVLTSIEKDIAEMNAFMREGITNALSVPEIPSEIEESPEVPKGRYQLHVTYDRAGKKWGVKEAGVRQPLSVFATKKEAVNQARKRAKENQPSQIKIHKQDGKIQEERTYGSDPTRTKG